MTWSQCPTPASSDAWVPLVLGFGNRLFFSPEIPSLKLTSKAPENGWLEYDPFLLGFGLFSGAFAVSFREGVLVKDVGDSIRDPFWDG